MPEQTWAHCRGGSCLWAGAMGVAGEAGRAGSLQVHPLGSCKASGQRCLHTGQVRGGGQVAGSDGTDAGSMRAAQDPCLGEAAPATAEALPVGEGMSCLQGGQGRGAGTDLQLARYPVRSKQSMQVWEKASELQDWFVV